MNKEWICFFSQTGTEIVEISKELRRWPDLIITNQRPERLRTINEEIQRSGKLIEVSNKPSLEEIQQVLVDYKDPIITLHGWLRIMPPEICENYTIFNGHPGLITDYDFLKGKDPQIRAFEKKLPTMGCVLHKVTAGVDEGRVIAQEKFNSVGITEQEMWEVTRDRSMYLWIKFLRGLVV